jgi:peptidyl-prolyl cis-trans isomerase SurA
LGRAVPAKKTRRGLALGAVGLGACTLIAACSPVQAGSAAIVGSQRITSSSLDQQVSNLQGAIKSYNGQVSLTSAEQPRAVLTWLIRFSIMDQVAADSSISVTQAQSQAGLSEIQSEAASSASQEGYSSATALFLSNGISPQMLPALGTWVAQESAYQIKANGGKQVTSQAESTAVTAKYNKAECQAAKSLNIQVSPQFGRLDYTQYTVVPATSTLSQPAGVPSPASTTGLTPAC